VLDPTSALLRIAVAFGLGFALGLERELRGQDAGLRTHILVCLGSCLFTVSSLAIANPIGPDTPNGVEVDISRIASQVVVGIGFLGGGSILHYGATVKGLTTAANLWLTASVGLAVGIGFLLPAAVTAALALLALVGLRFLEHLIYRLRRRFGLVDEDHLASEVGEQADEQLRPGDGRDR
jgi:putative Mg2+ transporter-C (MgtC) family protein